jgi:hypothetical protein
MDGIQTQNLSIPRLTATKEPNHAPHLRLRVTYSLNAQRKGHYPMTESKNRQWILKALTIDGGMAL